jgi:flagellar basal body rod protein FlgB
LNFNTAEKNNILLKPEQSFENCRNVDFEENPILKEKYYKALNEKDNKRMFQVFYIFRNKIKRMYRIDCMTRKINVNFFHYIKENYNNLNINEELLEFFKSNIRYTSRTKFQDLNIKYPKFKEIYDGYLKSPQFKKLVNMIRNKYDDEYLKLFFRHSINFLNFYLKEVDIPKDQKRFKKLKRLSKQ